MRTALGVACAGVLILAFVCPVSATDAGGQGFVLGFGLGLGVMSFENVSFQHVDGDTFEIPFGYYTSGRLVRPALMTDFRIGYALTDRLQVCSMNTISWYSLEAVGGSDSIRASMILGLGAVYSFRPRAPSLYIAAGGGVYLGGAPFGGSFGSNPTSGMSAAAGYEFSEHFALEATFRRRGTGGSFSAGLGAVIVKY